MRITPEQIEQVRDATNIVDLISESVTLKKRGANWLGLCPFHNERTPSFNVREDKGIFKCFGCGKGGDAFSFVMESEGLNFPDAIKRLAERANIKLEDATEEEKAEQTEKERVLTTLRAVAGWYYKALRAPVGAEPLKYLHRRGFGEAVLKKFGIGYAPDVRGALSKSLERKGYDPKMLEMGGVVAVSPGREPYERFRGRIIFPVFSATGRIIGFGGRIYTDAQKQAELAKYINSPDTIVYHKSRVLYGLYQAKDAIRKHDSAILVEGYADVLALHQAGFENAVAASGTSLTREQLELLRRYTQTLTLIFDADQAGKSATERGIELALTAGFDVNIVLLRQGEDPDSYIRNFGADRFADALKNYSSFIETKARWFEEQGAFNDPARAAQAIKAIVQTIAKIPDAIKREFFIRKLASRFRFSEQTLNAELTRAQTGVRKREKIEVRAPQPPEPAEPPDTPTRVRQALSGPHRVLLQAALADPVGVCQQFDEVGFTASLISDEVVRSIIEYICSEVQLGRHPEVNTVLAHFRADEARQEVIVECSISNLSVSDALRNDASSEEGKSLAVKQARDAAIALLRDQVTSQLESVRARVKVARVEDLEDTLIQAEQLSRRLEALRNLSEPSS